MLIKSHSDTYTRGEKFNWEQGLPTTKPRMIRRIRKGWRVYKIMWLRKERD